MLNKVILKIGDDSNILCEIINARQINLRFSSFVEEVIFDDEIYHLRIGEGGISLSDNLVVPIDAKINSIYKIKKIEKLREGSYSIYSSMETKVSKFILPILSTDYTTKEYFLIDTFFENAYLKSPKIPLEIKTEIPINPDSCYILILLYRYSESEIYRKFESTIIRHPKFIVKKDINKSQVIFIFNIEEYKKDIDLFKEGCYSKLSQKLKNKIINFYNYSIGGTMYNILYKSPILRKQIELEFDVAIHKDMELYSKPDLKEEYYSINYA